jgi:putative transcriptional regulator
LSIVYYTLTLLRNDGWGQGMTKSVTQLKIVNCLHVFRAQHRVTQEQLAKEIGVTRATIVAIEGGGYNPSLELAFRIARYFKTDINTIFSVEEENE